ncbi:hypothetical protein I316_02608 [Kwoniella heveanensis BCC8398]|uniref:Large ribosomal subunit protein bL21m n=1 Tax=Kwoniella heveanensis BCC8398 TaxID=1296120 RepID=A0A1B9GX81_9TREE|nr:hypothetical protein I316_02608 [Kwoniella heveanensis BCC8398]
MPAFARLSVRGLQTTAPLPPPTTPLPPSDGQASVASTSSSASASAAAIAHLPPIVPSSVASSSSFSLPVAPSSTSSAIQHLESQSTPSAGRYVLARLHARTYLLHPRDILTLPTLKPMQPPGTTLSLTKILEVGSRDYAIRSPAASPNLHKRGLDWKEKKLLKLESIPSEIVRCELTVLEHTKDPLIKVDKKKRRKGYKKTIQHKQGYTRLRVGDIHLAQAE